MTALIATIGRATAWFANLTSERRAPECGRVDGLWEMLTPQEREAAFNFQGDDTIGRR